MCDTSKNTINILKNPNNYDYGKYILTTRLSFLLFDPFNKPLLKVIFRFVVMVQPPAATGVIVLSVFV